MGAVINIIKVASQNNQATIVSEIANKMQDNLANMMKDFEKNLRAKMNMPNTNNRNKRLHSCGDHENHVIVVENEEEGENGYTKQKWSEVVSKNISEKLKGIPVDKTSINKDGKGCVFFPSKDAQEKAKQALDTDFKVVSSSKPKRNVMPKLKIFNVETDNKDKLTECIIEKNHEIASLLENDDSKFEVLLIDSVRKHAIAKVSPDIRSAILSKGRM